MVCVTFVVTNMELVKVHFSSHCPSLKETYGRRGGSLFGLLMTSDLAGFHKTIPSNSTTTNHFSVESLDATVGLISGA